MKVLLDNFLCEIDSDKKIHFIYETCVNVLNLRFFHKTTLLFATKPCDFWPESWNVTVCDTSGANLYHIRVLIHDQCAIPNSVIHEKPTQQWLVTVNLTSGHVTHFFPTLQACLSLNREVCY